jgi:hypothetical protein
LNLIGEITAVWTVTPLGLLEEVSEEACCLRLQSRRISQRFDKVMKDHVMYFSLVSRHFFSLRYEFPSQYPFLKHNQSVFFLESKRPSFTPIHKIRIVLLNGRVEKNKYMVIYRDQHAGQNQTKII